MAKLNLGKTLWKGLRDGVLAGGAAAGGTFAVDANADPAVSGIVGAVVALFTAARNVWKILKKG